MNYKIVLLLLLLPAMAVATDYESFIEPDQEIEVAAPEIGVLGEVAVREGARVKKGDLLAKLLSRDLEAELATARARSQATGRMQAAQAQQRLHQSQLDKLLPLEQKGIARPQEISQTRAELEAAQATVLAARQDLDVAKLEMARIQAQIDNRILRSPIDGIVTAVLRDQAELVGGQHSHVLTVATENPLKVTVHAATAEAVAMAVDQIVQIELPGYPTPTAQGKIAFISPVTDAGSDTVTVRIRVDNGEGKLRSGIRCIVRTHGQP